MSDTGMTRGTEQVPGPRSLARGTEALVCRRGVRRRRRAAAVAAVLAVVMLAGCVEKVETSSGGGSAGGTSPLAVIGGSNTGSGTVLSKYVGQKLSFGTVPAQTTKAGSGPPIKVGMINQENTPLGSFPNLRLGADAAAKFINEELGGVNGTPMQIVPCITTFSVEKSQACAQQLVQEGVIAVTGGVDITSNGSMPVLEQNNMPYIGGIPINFAEMRSPISFQFSGGMAGAFVAFAKHASDNGAKKIVFAYADYPPIKESAQMGIAVARKLGIPEVIEVPFPVTATDLLPTMTKAGESDPDAILVGAADTACAPALKTAHDLKMRAQLYLVGSCLAPSVAQQVGADAVEGKMFNIESPASADAPEGQLYFDAAAKYGDPQLQAASEATIAFRDVMNIWMLLKELGAGNVSTAALLAKVREARDHPSFDGHPFTCDGKQMAQFSAVCAPQQIIVQRKGESVVPLTSWVDVPNLVAGL